MKDSGVALLDVYIGKILKLRRTMLGMSQDELACLIGVTFQQVQKYESGANRISASRLYVISRVLQVDVGIFFYGLEKEYPELSEVPVDSNQVNEGVVEFEHLENSVRDDEAIGFIEAIKKLTGFRKEVNKGLKGFKYLPRKYNDMLYDRKVLELIVEIGRLTTPKKEIVRSLVQSMGDSV